MWHWYKNIAVEEVENWQELSRDLPNTVISEGFQATKAIIDIYWEHEAQALLFQAAHGGKIERMDETDWVAATAPENQPPLLIRQQLVICASDDADILANLRAQYPKRIILSFPAEMAFGTGDHATTSTCLRLLCDYAKTHRDKSWQLSDIGCGTGVLALAGIKLGAKRAISFDFDPKAVEIAQRNIERNGDAENIDLFQADVFEWVAKEEERSELVLANLFSTVLQQAFPHIIETMKPCGTLIISGILRSQAEETIAAAQSHGLILEKSITRGKWTTAQLHRAN